jgi:hypothetical protein
MKPIFWPFLRGMRAASTGAVITVIESRRADINVATVPGTPWQNGMFMEGRKVPGAKSGVTTVLLRALPERFH